MNEENNEQSTLKPELSFHCVRPHNRMVWSYNVDQAMNELFKAKAKQNQERKQVIEGSEVKGKDWPEPEGEIGKGKENLFIASNGIMIWYESQAENYPETLDEYEARFSEQIDETIEMAKQYKEEIEDLGLKEIEAGIFDQWIHDLEELKHFTGK